MLESIQSSKFVFKDLVRKVNLSSTIDGDPFGNCQNFSISHFNNILTRSDASSILSEIFSKVAKKVLVVDIKEDLLSYVDNLFEKDSILVKTKYKNTNGTRMAILLIKKEGLKNKTPMKKKYDNLYEELRDLGIKTKAGVSKHIHGKTINIKKGYNITGHNYPDSFVADYNSTFTSTFDSRTRFVINRETGTYCYLTEMEALTPHDISIEDIDEEIKLKKEMLKQDIEDLNNVKKLMKSLKLEKISASKIETYKLIQRIESIEDTNEKVGLLEKQLRNV